MEQRYDSRLQERKAANLFRALPVAQLPGLDFTNNDYLGLSRNQTVVYAVIQAVEKYGLGGQASRLLGAQAELTRQLESEIAAVKSDQGQCLIFPTGYQLNSSVISTLLSPDLLGEEPLVFADRLIHASMHAGIRLASARQIRFRHNDMQHLESLLKKKAANSRAAFVFVESAYGMDGDVAPLDELYDLKSKYGFTLYVDEAHAVGVAGEQGYGLSRQSAGHADIVIGTFSKGLGASGGYVVSSSTVRDLLINFSPGFVYSTAPSPAVIAGVRAAWNLLPALEEKREHLRQLARHFREAMQRLQLDTGRSQTHLVPVILGDTERALQTQAQLAEKQIHVACIRPPTVPDGTSRLRISLCANHTFDQVDDLISALGDCR